MSDGDRLEAADTGSPRDELRELCAATRALVEWHQAAGALGLPTDEPAEAVLATLLAAKPGARRGAPAAPPPRAAVAPLATPFAPPPSRGMVAPPVGAVFSAAAFPRPVAAAPPPVAVSPPPVAAAPPPVAASPPPVTASPPPVTASPAPVAASPAPVAASPRPPQEEVPDDERRTRLALVAEEVASCQRCALHAGRTRTAFARGDPFAELCFVGEGPGFDEDQQGLPFVGKAGQLLDKMIAAMGYPRDAVYICNIVKCRPPENRKPEPGEMAACLGYLTSQLTLVKPKVIVALGATAVQGLTGTSEGITRMRGTWRLYKGTIPIMPTFHPAYLLRQPEAKKDVWSDLKQVMKHLGRAPGPG